jgi:hypothetical protein
MYYPPPSAAAGGAPAAPFGLPPNLAHLGALLQQAVQLPPQQAQAAATALQQYPPAGSYPGLPSSFPSMPPQSSMYPGSQNAPPAGAYGYPASQSAQPPRAPGGYPGADLYSALKQVPGGQPSSAAPPDAARYNYPPSNQQTTVPPAPSTSSIQDIMALLVSSLFCLQFLSHGFAEAAKSKLISGFFVVFYVWFCLKLQRKGFMYAMSKDYMKCR